VLQLWLGHELGSAVEPLLPPLVLAYGLTTIANISGAQLGPLNRLGTGLIIHIIAGLMVVACVFAGWRWHGVIGVAWGFLVSRLLFLLQDFFVINLIHAKGWLSATRLSFIVIQIALGAIFWWVVHITHIGLWPQLILAVLHGTLVAAWLARKDIAAWRSITSKPALQVEA